MSEMVSTARIEIVTFILKRFAYQRGGLPCLSISLSLAWLPNLSALSISPLVVEQLTQLRGLSCTCGVKIERLRADLAGAERALHRAEDEAEQHAAAARSAEAAMQQLQDQFDQQEAVLRSVQEQVRPSTRELFVLDRFILSCRMACQKP